MASASTSSVEKSYVYDVFISFRGKDLRKAFFDHLCEGFRRQGIIVFRDNKHIEVGEKISDELPKAIKDSKFHMVIFSKRYADSYWCLNELADILESQKPGHSTFYPIFYDVTPSDVREQKGRVKKAFAKHSENEAAGRWRAAMAQAASMEGLELSKTGDGHEVQFIEKIVRTISQKPYFASFGVNHKLVGTEAPVEKLILSLEVGVDDFRMIGITGMGGVGKTTLARVLFNQIANQFDGKSFVENVRECSKDARGLQDMQKQILTSVFCDQSIAVPSDFEGANTMQRRMPSIKVLVVLDDVNDAKQLEALAEPSWFKKGSRIIITSRDRQVLVAHGVQSHNIHDVSTLSHEDAIRLLSKYAFNTESPAQGYEKLSEKVVKYAAGLPLTIKTLGSSLRDGLVQYWKGTIKRLKKIPCGDTLGTLKISYDSLEEDQKEIFLYVACLFKGETKKEAIRILKSLGFEARVGLRVLEQKSVITLRHKYDYLNIAIDDDYKRLDMHDHIEEMGMHIVRSLHPNEPQQHKLLWNRDEIEDIIENDMGTKAIRGIKLLYPDLCPAKLSQSLRKMRRLCFLQVELLSGYRSNKAGRNYLPNSLQFLHWKGYPYRYLPKTFQGDKLVEINMPDSSIRQLWKGGEKKVLPKLRLLNLSGSNLKTFDSAGMTPNLKELLLRECYELVEVNICDECSHLKKLDLSKCKALKKLTISKDCTSPLLEVLSVELCEALEELVMPVGCPELTEVSINGNHKLRCFNLGQSYKVEVFSAEGCEELEELVMPAKCPWLTQFSLKVNDKLRSLNLEMASNLEVLSVEDCKILEELVMPVECPMLTELSILKTKLRSFSLGSTPNLKRLILEQCEDLEELVMPVECPMLTKLSLCDNDKLRNLNLVQAPKLKKLRLEYCEGFENIYVPVELPRLRILEVFKYDSDEHYGSFSDLLDKLKILKKLRLFDKMKRLPDCIYMLQHHLRVLDLTRCRKLEELPDDLDGFECLVKLILRGCKSLLSIPDCICYMTRLERLNLSQCRKLEKLPDDFRHLQSLQVLNVSGGTAKRLKNLSESISQLKDLRVIGSS